MDYSGAKPGGLNPNEKAALMTNIKHQLEVAQATELLQTITEKCFKMCVQKPGSSLGGSEQKCITYCIDRFIDAANIVGRAYSQRLQKELANAR